MNPVIRNILAVLGGLISGSIVNMGFILIGGEVIPPPAGADVSNMESLKSFMYLFEAEHFLFPFLAHALGTLTGAFATAKIAASFKRRLVLVIGTFFLLGGIYNACLLVPPVWFTIADLTVAYIPMGWLGGRIAENNNRC